MRNTTSENEISESQIKENVITLSKCYTNDIATTAITIKNIHENELDLNTVADCLVKEVEKFVNDGNAGSLECMLVTQAKTLNSVFHNMLTRAVQAKYIDHISAFSDIALKAQNQCRQTISTLNELQNPKHATFIKQQNNAINQQVNNDPPKRKKITKKSRNSTNELLKKEEYAQLDNKRTPSTIKINPSMEAMGAINRGKNS